MADNSKTKERLKEITDSIENGIKELFESDKYQQYLRTMSRFHSYSLNNTVLIAMQKPDATLVAGFNKWRDQFSRNVKKGERSIKIIAPTPYKVKKEQEKLDPVTKAPMLDTNGKVLTEEVEIKIPMYKVVSVFDVSQTEGKPLPTLAENLTGDVKYFEIFMEALKRSSPVPLFFEKMPEDTDGYFHTTKQHIAIREGMSEIQTVSATIHEIAHSKLHNYEKERQEKVQSDENDEPIKPISRQTEEVEAESISFAVCSYYGIKTDENSFGYIAAWSKGKDLPELRASLETISKTSSALIEDIDRHFAEIVKEKGIDLSAEKEKLPAYYLTADKVNAIVTDYGTEGKLVSGELELLIQNVGTLANSINNKLIMWQSDHMGEGVPADVEQNIVEQQISALSKELAPKELAYQMGDFYFSIQTIEDGYDYSIYDKDYNLLDGGVYDDPDISIYKAIDYILEDEPAMDFSTAKDIDYEELTEKADQAWQESVAVKKAEVLSDEPMQEHTYPLPDPDISILDRNSYGYLYDEMLPLTKERATELFEQDLTVYLLYEDNTEAMAFDLKDIDNHGGIFGMERTDWIASKDFEELNAAERFSVLELEQRFLESPADAYAIYQLKSGDKYRDYSFEGLKSLENRGLSVERDNYNIVYSDKFTGFASTRERLEELWERFNIDHPDNFKGHSLSVSDIIAIKHNGIVTYHYCDSFDFVKLTKFLESVPLVPDSFLTGDRIDTPRGSFSLTSMTKEQMSAAGYGVHHTSDNGSYYIMGNGTHAFAVRNEDNPLRTAEMSTERNYNQIDGIINNQPTVAELEQTVKAGGQISLLNLSRAIREDKKEKRISVVEQLKNQSVANKEKQKTAPYTSAEMER